jgi:hypothetical protein
MALLSDRQKTAERLTRELQALGATVTSVLPLPDDQRLKFWVHDNQKREVLTQLRDGNYGPTFVGIQLQFVTCSYAAEMVSKFEIDLPRERQAVPIAERRIPDAVLASSEPKSNYEVERVMRYLGMAGKK